MSLRAVDIAAAVGTPPPTVEQVAVVEASPRPLLVIAGAGSGKTETMAARVVWLVANGHVDPDQVLGLTFTRKAAGELSERIGRRLRGLRAAGLWSPRTDDDTGAEVLGGTATVSTYHAYAGRLVREHGLRLGVEPESRLLTEAAAWQYAAEVVGRYDGPMDDVDWAESTVIEAVVALAGEMAEHLVAPAQVEAHLDAVLEALAAVPAGSGRLRKHPLGEVITALRARRALLPLVEAYAQLKRSRDCLDFADQMALAARLAREVPRVGAAERLRYRAVLLDEFQDTSEAQLVLLRSLFASGASRVSVTAVGDPHQSIYGWRGASATTLQRFPGEFADPDGPAEVRPLSTSWRNDRAVLAAANVVAGPLRAQARVPVLPLSPRPGAGAGWVGAARYLTVEDEAAAVAAWVARRWASPSGRRTGATAAVICRKRSQFPLVVDALRARGLPVEVVGLGGLLLTPEVADLVSLLWVVSDPSRGDHLMRLITGPPACLGAADLDALSAWARALDDRHHGIADVRRIRDLAPESVGGVGLGEAIDELPPPGWVGPTGQWLSDVARQRLADLARLVRHVRSLSGLGLAELVGEAERALGLDVEAAARPEHTPTSARAHLDAFADTAAAFSSSADRPTLAGFLAWLAAAVEQERGLDTPTLETSRDAVQVLTAHAAKGLEWDVVAIPGLVEGGFPAREHGVTPAWDGTQWRVKDPLDKGWTTGASGVPYPLRGDADGLPRFATTAADWSELKAAYDDFRAAGGAHELAEERRLLYVATTRARREMLLTASIWSDPGKPRVSAATLDDLRTAGVSETVTWVAMPEPDDDGVTANPRLANAVTAPWPTGAPAGRPGVDDAATAVERARAAGAPAGGPMWARVRMLLVEEQTRQQPTEPAALLGRHLSTSALVALARDPEAYAAAVRRPMPAPVATASRRGTAFHAWVEGHFGQATMVDWLDLPGSADEGQNPEPELTRLRELFLASEWATQTPLAVESSVETVVDGIAIRGRIDAVFPRPGGGVTLVDWKTGPRPSGPAAEVAALQLGAYALAYRRLHDLRDDAVEAAFYYAPTGETVRVALPGEEDIRAILAAVPNADPPAAARTVT